MVILLVLSTVDSPQGARRLLIALIGTTVEFKLVSCGIQVVNRWDKSFLSRPRISHSHRSLTQSGIFAEFDSKADRAPHQTGNRKNRCGVEIQRLKPPVICLLKIWHEWDLFPLSGACADFRCTWFPPLRKRRERMGSKYPPMSRKSKTWGQKGMGRPD